jgi:hypothetical protein
MYIINGFVYNFKNYIFVVNINIEWNYTENQRDGREVGQSIVIWEEKD